MFLRLSSVHAGAILAVTTLDPRLRSQEQRVSRKQAVVAEIAGEGAVRQLRHRFGPSHAWLPTKTHTQNALHHATRAWAMPDAVRVVGGC